MGKKMTAALEKIEPRLYGLKEAVEAVKQAAFAKYDESVDLAIRLGVDPKRSDQMVRGTTALPHGTGKKLRVLVFAKGEKEQEARQAGADFVGADDIDAVLPERRAHRRRGVGLAGRNLQFNLCRYFLSHGYSLKPMD